MKVHEYQAKAILSQFGIPVPDGGVASTSQEVNNIMEKLGGSGVIKAQIHAGGRGMAGGVKVVGSAEEAETTAEKLLGTKLVTHQTGPEGASVDNVLIEQTLSVAKEYYLAIVIDGSTRSPVIMASEAGGMDIEEVASKFPENIFRIKLN